jgi:hypothetical protein
LQNTEAGGIDATGQLPTFLFHIQIWPSAGLFLRLTELAGHHVTLEVTRGNIGVRR